LSNLDYKILKFLQRYGKPIKIGSIAKKLNIPHSTAGSSISRLKNEKLIHYKPYHHVTLTQKGREKSLELIRHSQLFEVLLFNELDISADDAHKESERINFLFSCETINKICEKYNHPNRCPCGNPILQSKSCHCEIEH
jgi:DtxR family Mn-dependent transcriptional regulator